MLYWILTGLFTAFMIFTAIPDITMSGDAVTLITGLGYPKYFIPFIGVAKVSGCAVILLPGLKRMKEWAYAGLFFDLSGAVYSGIAMAGFDPQMTFMVLPISFLFLSYFLWHQKTEAQSKSITKI